VGFLRNLNDKATPFGGGAVVFWGIVGVAAGVTLATLLHWQDTPTVVVSGAGGVLGLCFGLYVATGTTTLARVLAVPGALMELLPW
jgi:cbb3-type cytochrome oxidase subunit 1